MRMSTTLPLLSISMFLPKNAHALRSPTPSCVKRRDDGRGTLCGGESWSMRGDTPDQREQGEQTQPEVYPGLQQSSGPGRGVS